eukprot:1145758-Pelagomonas_calceolata.AAC.1
MFPRSVDLYTQLWFGLVVGTFFLRRIGEIACRIDELMRPLGMADAMMTEEYKQLLNSVYKHAENAQL